MLEQGPEILHEGRNQRVTNQTRLCYDRLMALFAPRSFRLSLLFSLVALGCAGRPSGSSEAFGHSADLAPRGETRDAGLDASVAILVPIREGDVHFDAGAPDPSRLLSESDRNQAISPSSAGQLGNSGLVLHVAERGPDKPWIIAVTNTGPTPAVLVADTRLLWLEVNVPGAKKAATCRLPLDLLPRDAEPRLNVTLAPGESVVQLADPRLYCFASGDQKLLVPGARVVTHLGWPELPEKTAWLRGKASKTPVPQPPPFVAHEADVDIEAAVQARTNALRVAKSARRPKSSPPPSAESLGVPLPAGVDKQLRGPELVLQDTYAEWSSKRRASTAAVTEDSPLELRVVQGSDAKTEHDATIQVTVRNRSRKKVLVYLRREFVTYEVVGPAGALACDPRPDTRAPDREAFVTLAPSASKSFSVRLAEMCPRDTFDMPGLYLVNATYDANESGSQWNLAAFTGEVSSTKPANVRIRVGELSILQKVVLQKMQEPTKTAAALPTATDAGTTAK